MASSMLTGDRRWASSRKSGMTVLGKVPKPINLPSQRLENHGLDPEVEIVPKGTLTWGSKPSEASPNAWGASSHSSVHADSGVSSPSHLAGRPSSSGGTGTRPSIAESESSLEATTNAWVSNSRPSSASGVLSANQKSTLAARPRSAETRPGSSQLSRFAEAIPENSVPYRTADAADRVGHMSSKRNDFALTSGDFPTLGSEKSASDLQNRPGSRSLSGRPSSASSLGVSRKERLEVAGNEHEVTDVPSEKGNTNNWKMDSPAPSDIDNCQRDHHVSQQYPNISNSQQHLSAWHGPPVGNPPDGIWYRGVPCVGPYRPSGPPGNYAVESFPYYSSQHPDRSMPSSQATQRPEPVLGAYPRKSEDSFHPHMPPDSYMVRHAPIVSVRPGIFHGPMPNYGYFGPSRPNLDSTGGATGHAIFNQYQNHYAPNCHPRPAFHGQPTSLSHSEHMEAGQTHDTHGGQFRVLLKQHDGNARNVTEEKGVHHASGNSQHVGTTAVPAAIKRDAAQMTEKSSYTTANLSDNSELTSHSVFSGNSVKGDAVNSDQAKKCKPAITTMEAPQSIGNKNHTLIEKIEGLNNKARIVDGRTDGSLSGKGEKFRRIKNDNGRPHYSRESNRAHATSFEKGSREQVPTGGATSGAYIADVSLKGSNTGSSNAKIMPRSLDVLQQTQHYNKKDVHGKNDQDDFHVNSRFNCQGVDERRKQLPGGHSSSVNMATGMEKCADIGSESCLTSEELSNRQALLHESDIDEANSLSTVDYTVQRAKMKEIAIQRAKQLQKEEEERTREQKAKALAKLEELNKRMLIDNVNSKMDSIPPPNDECNTAKSNGIANVIASASIPNPVIDETSISAPAITCSDTIVKKRGHGTCKNGDVQINSSVICNAPGTVDAESSESAGGSCVSSCEHVIDKPGSNTVTGRYDSNRSKPGVAREVTQPKSLLSSDDTITGDSGASISSQKTDVQGAGAAVSKQKQTGQKRRQIIKHDKSLLDRPSSPYNSSSTQVHQEPAHVHSTVADGVESNVSASGEVSFPHRKRGSRSTRSKNRQDESQTISTLLSVSDTKGIRKMPLEDRKMNSLVSASEPALVDEGQSSKETSARQNPENVFVSSNHGWSQGREEGNAKAVNQWKSHHPRKTTRNSQARPADKIHGTEAVWAPVKPLCKNEQIQVVASDTTNEVSNFASAKNANDLQSNVKGKMTEMERYVPKVVAKDSSQQGNRQQSSGLHQVRPAHLIPNPNITSSQSINEGRESSVAKAEISSGGKNTDHGKPGKSHTSWRQRSSHERISDHTEASKMLSDDKESTKHATSIAEVAHPSGDKNHGNASTLLKDESLSFVEKGATNRGKRQTQNQQKTAVITTVSGVAKNSCSETADKLDTLPTLGARETEFKTSTTANRNAGENSRPHWKPKAQVHSSGDHQEDTRYKQGQRLSTQSGAVDKVQLELVDNHQLGDADKNNVAWGIGSCEAGNAPRHEADRERKGITRPFKNQTVVQNQEFSNVAGQETSCPGGQDFSSDTAKHHQAAKSGGARPNSNYGYQKVEYQTKQKDSFHGSGEPKDGFNGSGANHRGRGHNHSRRGGHFHARNSGSSTHAGITHEVGE